MPVSTDYTVKSIESGQTKCDSRQEMSYEDFFLYVEHFVRFLFMLNKLTRIRLSANESCHRVKLNNSSIIHFLYIFIFSLLIQ
jgi:hypothetical protein